uniref:Similar to ATP-dependent helicase n=1 Tax=Arundo donax TaxID=35708 RepID=A0A0A9G7N5_ARUDO
MVLSCQISSACKDLACANKLDIHPTQEFLCVHTTTPTSIPKRQKSGPQAYGYSNSCDIQACRKHDVTLNSIRRNLHLLVQRRVPHYGSCIPELSARFIQPNDCSYNEPFGYIRQLTYVCERRPLCPLVDNLNKAKLEIITCILLGIHGHLELCLELS